MGRKPIGERAMTAAERQQKRRQQLGIWWSLATDLASMGRCAVGQPCGDRRDREDRGLASIR